MKKIKLLLMPLLAVFAFTGCEDDVEAPGTNYVTFEDSNYSFEVTPGGETTRDIYVYSANKTGSDRTFNVNILADESTADPSVYNVPATVTIPADTNVGTLSVMGSDVNDDLDFSNPLTVVLELAPEAKLSVGEKMTVNLLKECIYNKVFFNIAFDSWPEEVYWEIINNDTSEQVAENGPYSAYNNAYAGMSGTFATTLCLPDGSYTFYIYDDYADGAGAVSLTSSDGTVLFESDGSYGAGASASFTL